MKNTAISIPAAAISHRRRQQGLTLLQLTIGIAIISLIGSLSVGSFNAIAERQRALAARSTFHGLFHFARSQAIYTQQPVTVCALTTVSQCTRNWSGDRRIAVFHDVNRNRFLDPDDRQLRLLNWPSHRGEVHWKASLARPFIDFLPAGNTWQNGTLFYCPASGNQRYATALVLNHAGRTYRPGDSDGDGIDEDREQQPVIC